MVRVSNRNISSFCVVILILLWSGLGLSACAGAGAGVPPETDIGIDVVSPDGHWATIIERKVGTDSWQLSLLNLEQPGDKIKLDEITTSRPHSSFSPDSKIVLYNNPIGSTGQYTATFRFASNEDSKDRFSGIATVKVPGEFEFLPNGRLLLSSFDNGLLEFSTIIDFDEFRNTGLESVEKEIGLVNYNFRNPPTLPDPLFVDYLRQVSGLSGLDTSTVAQISGCVNLPMRDSIAWVFINTKDELSIVRADALQFNKGDLGKAPFRELTEMIHQQRDVIYKDKPVAEALEKLKYSLGENDAHQIAKMLEIILISSFGLPSPNGEHLMVMLPEKGEYEQWLYSLYLVDLKIGNSILLSEKTDWIPYFTFSPDGQKVLFQSGEPDNPVLYLVDVDHLDKPRKLVTGALSPCWH